MRSDRVSALHIPEPHLSLLLPVNIGVSGVSCTYADFRRSHRVDQGGKDPCSKEFEVSGLRL
jgi:hypothetical protein